MPFYMNILVACSVSKQSCLNILKAPGITIVVRCCGELERASWDGGFDAEMKVSWFSLLRMCGRLLILMGDTWVGQDSSSLRFNMGNALSPLVLTGVGFYILVIVLIWSLYSRLVKMKFVSICIFVATRLNDTDNRYTNKCQMSGGPRYMCSSPAW